MSIDLDRLRASLLPQTVSGHFVSEDGGDEQELAWRPPSSSHRPAGRRAYRPPHPAHRASGTMGQISFPGGRVEATTRRRWRRRCVKPPRKSGLAPDHVDILGFLPEYRTGTGFASSRWSSGAPLRPDPGPFQVAGSSRCRSPSSSIPPTTSAIPSIIGGAAPLYAMPLRRLRFIWGATAG